MFHGADNVFGYEGKMTHEAQSDTFGFRTGKGKRVMSLMKVVGCTNLPFYVIAFLHF